MKKMKFRVSMRIFIINFKYCLFFSFVIEHSYRESWEKKHVLENTINKNTFCIHNTYSVYVRSVYIKKVINLKWTNESRRIYEKAQWVKFVDRGGDPFLSICRQKSGEKLLSRSNANLVLFPIFRRIPVDSHCNPIRCFYSLFLVIRVGPIKNLSILEQ